MNVVPIPFAKWLENNDLDRDDCDECRGWGNVDCDVCDGEGELFGIPCADCRGSGSVTCNECGGSGSNHYAKYKLQVKIDLELLSLYKSTDM